MTKRYQPIEANIDRETANTLIRRIAELSLAMDKMNIAEYVEFLRNPRRIIFVNFLGGLARGFGIGIGATILAALFIIILSRIVQLLHRCALLFHREHLRLLQDRFFQPYAA
jgi:hypothetical protein